jgi:pimeloyl-ACP methyl ester carboxylesterase
MKNPLTFTCSGEFCNLILVLDPDRDLILNTKSGNDQCIDSKKNLSKTDRDIQARDRAYRIASKVLARSELSRLEDSGNLMRLRIPDRINPCEMKYISEDSVQTSKREFRSTLLELKLAEENNRSWRVEGDEHFGRESVPSLSSISNNCTPVENSKGMVAVCSICFHVYNLLHRVRTLLSYQSKSTVNTEVETPTSAQPCVSFDQDEKNEMLRKGPRWEKISAWKQVTHLPVMNRCDEPRQVTFTPHLNGIADLLEDFEAAKRSIEETCNNIMNHENGENKYAGFGAILHEKSHTETKDATENKTSAFYTKSPIKVKEPIQKTNSNQDHKRQPITNSIKAAAAESEVNDDQQMMMSIFHLDDSTSLPYRILKNRASHTNESSTTPLFYNLIVCNDIFDHYERFIALFMPMVMRYPSLQVLLWNYPGQALTTYANNISMDNIFFSDCLHKLLSWVGDSGTKEFETTRPFYIMGVGCGGSVATLFASRHQEQSLRAILLINPLLFIDSHLASVVHDCRNAFSCSPEARPDIPTYFFSRFLFSTEYLQRVSAPQALNNYTSEPNPITIKGRLKLCQAVLNFVDVRDNIQSIHRPIISIHGQSSCFVRPSQAAYLLNGRHCCETIFQALRGKANSSIVYMVKGGHELMQEKRGSMSILIEQLLTKYHDMFEVIPSADLFALKNTAPNDPSTVNRMERIVLINNPDVKCKKISPDSNLHDAGNKPCSDHNETLRWEAYKKEIEKKLKPLNRRMKRRVRQRDDIVALSQTSLQQGSPNTLIVLDPHKPSFERYENKVYRPGSSIIYPDPDSLPRVKELMEWRLRRNEKRLSHFHRAALVIQKALRMNFSKTIFSRIKKDASAILIQKYFRGMLGKKECIKIRHELWAAKLVQRTYRGHLGRSKSYGIRMAIACQSKIARRWRGLRARRVVQNLLKYRFNAATVLQSFWRKYKARCFLKWLRVCRRSSIYIQRVFRGYKGRRKAASERDMYIFSRSQCSGIEMGRRLLAEHKLSANRLRSELNIIDQEKNAIKVRLDELREEILSFEKNVSELERQMHKICIFEREHPTAAAGGGKFELKEKKMYVKDANYRNPIFLHQPHMILITLLGVWMRSSRSCSQESMIAEICFKNWNRN